MASEEGNEILVGRVLDPDGWHENDGFDADFRGPLRQHAGRVGVVSCCISGKTT